MRFWNIKLSKPQLKVTENIFIISLFWNTALPLRLAVEKLTLFVIIQLGRREGEGWGSDRRPPTWTNCNCCLISSFFMTKKYGIVFDFLGFDRTNRVTPGSAPVQNPASLLGQLTSLIVIIYQYSLNNDFSNCFLSYCQQVLAKTWKTILCIYFLIYWIDTIFDVETAS